MSITIAKSIFSRIPGTSGKPAANQCIEEKLSCSTAMNQSSGSVAMAAPVVGMTTARAAEETATKAQPLTSVQPNQESDDCAPDEAALVSQSNMSGIVYVFLS